ncbi:MAG: TIGR03619 family F420-dependent LLM class oxidoreductase [Gammaproteobacteria bacterium]|nr:TIGR03619 family F420-dependent LLM class oxidoreductase [Gammaproteobacteria bacterium]
MNARKTTFGIAMRNFTRYPELPDPQALIDYGVRMEELGFESLWVWDHILLGVDPHFPIIDSLTLLTAVAARTSRIRIGTGVLILPLRNPLVLAKQIAGIDQVSGGRFILGTAAGWYKREFDAVGIPFNKRGKLMDQNLEIMTRLWEEDMVTLEQSPYNLQNAVMFPKPAQRPRPPILIGGYVDRVLKRAGVTGDGWLTYFYKPDSFVKSWAKVRDFAEQAGKDPDTLTNCNQLPICVGESESAVKEKMDHWLNTEWDFAGWSESTPESAIMGTPDQCIEKLQEHMDAGVERIIFVPYRYEQDQIDLIAREILPKLQASN